MSVPGKPNRVQDHFAEWVEFDCPTDGLNYSIAVANRVWDTGTLAWVSETQPGGGGGGSVTQGTVPWVTDQRPYALQFDSAATPVLYLGEALAGVATSVASWRIQKIDTTTGVSIKWAGGASTFTQVWDNRASLVYS
jgi:hypothetical protein